MKVFLLSPLTAKPYHTCARNSAYMRCNMCYKTLLLLALPHTLMWDRQTLNLRNAFLVPLSEYPVSSSVRRVSTRSFCQVTHWCIFGGQKVVVLTTGVLITLQKFFVVYLQALGNVWLCNYTSWKATDVS